ncbi:MAG: hypothetical protein IBX71_06495, partial [Candidatus Desulforudis sp.]|nr:hypothetical protein [Desulforudis sp.]
MQLEVSSRNSDRLQEMRSLIAGVAINRSHLVVEYVSWSGGYRDIVVADLDQCRIWHT